MSDFPILQHAPHLPLLELAEQVVDLTSEVMVLSSTVSRIELEAKEANEAKIGQLEYRLRKLEGRDESPNRP
jgi:hypothetical protein